MSVANVLQENRVQRRTGERINGLGDTSTGSLYGNIVVFFEIDTSVLLQWVCNVVAKEFFFDTHVTTSYDMLAVFPGAVTESFARARVTRGG